MITKIFEKTAWVVVSCMHRPSRTFICDVSKALALYCTWLLVRRLSKVQPIVQICKSWPGISVSWMLSGVMMMNDVTTTAARVLLFVQCDRSSQHSDIW